MVTTKLTSNSLKRDTVDTVRHPPAAQGPQDIPHQDDHLTPLDLPPVAGGDQLGGEL